MLAYARSPAFLAPAPAAVMLAYLRSPAFLALALAALVGADARPQALLALAPDAVMLAYLRSPAFLALAPAAVMLAFSRRHSSTQRFCKLGLPWLLSWPHGRATGLHSSVSTTGKAQICSSSARSNLVCTSRFHLGLRRSSSPQPLAGRKPGGNGRRREAAPARFREPWFADCLPRTDERLDSTDRVLKGRAQFDTVCVLCPSECLTETLSM